MFDGQKKKSMILGGLSLVLLTGLLLFFVRHLNKEVFQILRSTGLRMTAVLTAGSILYILVDGLLYTAAFQGVLPGFTLRNGLALTILRIFGKTALVAGGALPLIGLYLHRKGMILGRSVGITTAMMVIEKIGLLLYTAVLLFLHWGWVHSASSNIGWYLLYGYTLSICIIAGILMVSTSQRIRNFVDSMIDKLPNSRKWPARKERWHGQIQALYQETQSLFKTKERFVKVLTLDFLKLFLFASIPFVTLQVMGINDIGFFQIQTLAAACMVLSGSIPNVAGMGAVELSFMLVFSQVLEKYTGAAMIYYRCATYYFPFLLSILGVFFIQKKMTRERLQEQTE